MVRHFYGRSKDDVADYIVKNVEALIEKRNRLHVLSALTKRASLKSLLLKSSTTVRAMKVSFRLATTL